MFTHIVNALRSILEMFHGHTERQIDTSYHVIDIFEDFEP